MMTWAVGSCAILSFVFAGAAAAQPPEDPLVTTWSLQGDELPEQKPWTAPASFAYTINEGAADSYAVDFAFRVDRQLRRRSDDTMFVRVVGHKTNQEKKEKEAFAGELGYQHIIVVRPSLARRASYSAGSSELQRDSYFIPVDLSVALASSTIFPEAGAVCPVPGAAQCRKQHKQSLRAMVTAQPYKFGWDRTFAYADSSHKELVGPAVAYSFGPVVSVFYDNILDAKIGADGTRIDGSVTGVKGIIGAAVSPRMFDYRLVLRASVQGIQTLGRSQARRGNFDDLTGLLKLSADIELGPRSFSADKGWVPAFGVSYTRGEDPLAEQEKRKRWVIGFKLTYKSE
ncbi:MAG TPA: hypothetical protein VFZ91_12625 [Allosphingosinicella sp.]